MKNPSPQIRILVLNGKNGTTKLYRAIQNPVLLENRVSRGLPVSETKTTKYIKEVQTWNFKIKQIVSKASASAFLN